MGKSDARDRRGVIATYSNGQVRHVEGFRKAALRDHADYCDARGLSIRSLSTPETVLRDLQGARIDLTEHGMLTWKSETHVATRVDYPEPVMLAKIGRADLWETP